MNKTVKALTLLTYIIMIVANALANILPINGMNTGEISDSFPNLFAPAGYTFAVWGLIYIMLGIFVINVLRYPSVASFSSKSKTLKEICLIFSFSNMVNAAWIISWHYLNIGISLVLMLIILICLVIITGKIKKTDFNQHEKIWIKPNLSFYFGWITVATIANVTTYLVSIGWDGLGMSEEFWLISMLIVGALISIVTMIRIVCPIYGVVVIWAYVGILVKHLSSSGFNGLYSNAIITLYITLLALIIGVVYSGRLVSKKMSDSNI